MLTLNFTDFILGIGILILNFTKKRRWEINNTINRGFIHLGHKQYTEKYAYVNNQWGQLNSLHVQF
jgi:hypothetical protein